MPIKSQYPNKCKDCGISYEIGDEIDTNGNKSPNKSGELKDHWCKNGKNCQGVMELQGGGNPSDPSFHPDELVVNPQLWKPTPKAEAQAALNQAERTVSKEEPTPEEIIALVRKYSTFSDDSINQRLKTIDEISWLVALDKAGSEKTMNLIGIKHPSRVSFMGEVMRRLS